MLPLHLQPESHIPLYVQLRDQFARWCIAGDFAHGRPHSRQPRTRRRSSAFIAPPLQTRTPNSNPRPDSRARRPRHIHLRHDSDSNFRRRRARTAMAAAMRWESLFADERGEEGLSRLMPDVPPGAIAFTVRAALRRNFSRSRNFAAARMRCCAAKAAAFCNLARPTATSR